MSLSASIVLSSLIIYAGPTIKAFTVGEHYVATGGWGTAVYWTAFLILGIVIAVGFCALPGRPRPPGGNPRPHFWARLET